MDSFASMLSTAQQKAGPLASQLSDQASILAQQAQSYAKPHVANIGRGPAATAKASPQPVMSQPEGTFLPGTQIQINTNSVTVDRFLAEGGFAHVYLVSTQTGKQVVLKRILCPDATLLDMIRNEIEFMKLLSGHPNIVTYFDSSVEKRRECYEVFILMENCSGGTLIDYMNNRLEVRLTEPEVLEIFLEVLAGVYRMHFTTPQSPILHRDLKIENVLIGADGRFKLCDFGSATTKRVRRGVSIPTSEVRKMEDEVEKVTTLQYRAPELCDLYTRMGVSEKVDVWPRFSLRIPQIDRMFTKSTREFASFYESNANYPLAAVIDAAFSVPAAVPVVPVLERTRNQDIPHSSDEEYAVDDDEDDDGATSGLTGGGKSGVDKYAMYLKSGGGGESDEERDDSLKVGKKDKRRSSVGKLFGGGGALFGGRRKSGGNLGAEWKSGGGGIGERRRSGESGSGSGGGGVAGFASLEDDEVEGALQGRRASGSSAAGTPTLASTARQKPPPPPVPAKLAASAVPAGLGEKAVLGGVSGAFWANDSSFASVGAVSQGASDSGAGSFWASDDAFAAAANPAPAVDGWATEASFETAFATQAAISDGKGWADEAAFETGSKGSQQKGVMNANVDLDDMDYNEGVGVAENI
ncbi:hypothetical protein HDU98_005052 [Podochytrium sp. JEL0797]|nr:hypothetical protein HDU98_005052 [Podochytrium sp. JEL0797]